MALKFSFGVAFLLSVWSAARCDLIPDGVLQMECHDRYFMIAVDLSFTGENPRFEAVDKLGVHAITKQYEAKCGYGVAVLALLGHVELHASYFSCHTHNEEDKTFTFNFNLITKRGGKEVAYPLNKTCSPSLPWAPREVTCGINYMEVLLGNEISCSHRMEKDDRTAVAPMHGSATSDWQVYFQKAEEHLPPMNLSQARKRGYVFDMTDGLIVFRTPYGQPDSFTTEVGGIQVETVQATLFSLQGWIVLMVDLVVACSMHPGSYDNGYMTWKTPEVLYPGLESVKISLGLNGELVKQPVAERQGYILDKKDAAVQISIPYDTKGGYRKSFVSDDLYEFYVFHLFFEQVLRDDFDVKTVLRFQRALVTPLLHSPVFTENRTVLEDRVFTVYLGDVPEDVELTSVLLNGHACEVHCSDLDAHNVTEVVYPNKTHGYTLKVPFSDPFVVKQFFTEAAILEYRLDINYTLTVHAQNEPYFHVVPIVAVFTDVSPPVFEALCRDSGIHFKMDHQPFDYLWDITIGSAPLTSKLADQHGYVLTNDSKSLLLEVPLFTHGYEYTGISLSGFAGTFTILVQDAETSVVQTTTTKTCPFTSSELIMCTTDGRMTVVADVSLAIPSEGMPASTTLIDKYCGPRETDATRALFTFPLGSCGTIVKIGKKNVTYQNEIFYKKYYNIKKLNTNATERVIVQCTYPLEGLHRLFSKFKFESDVIGVGRIIHTKQRAAGLKGPIIKPTAAIPTKPVTKRPPVKPMAFLTADHAPGHNIFSKFFNLINHKGIERSQQNAIKA